MMLAATTRAVRFSPRTTKSRVVRKYTYQTDLDYITDNTNRLSTRLNTAQFQTEFHNSDTFTVLFTRDYEFLSAPFQIARNVRLPVGGYTFQNVNLAYLGGQQRRINGTPSIEIGSFYDGTKRTVAFSGRASIVPQLSVEPKISVNWVKLPGRRLHLDRGGREHGLHDDAPEVRVRAHPVQFEHDFAIRERPLPLGVSTGQRDVRRLHGGALDASAVRHAASESRRRREDQSPVPDVASRGASAFRASLSPWLFPPRRA